MKRPTKYPYQRATKAQRRLGWTWFLVHHQAMAEPLTKPIAARVAWIREDKSPHQIETRLRAMRPASPEAHAAVARARAALEAAVARALEALEAAAARESAAYDAAVARESAALDAAVRPWFRRECRGVRWGRNGLVFPKEARRGK